MIEYEPNQEISMFIAHENFAPTTCIGNEQIEKLDGLRGMFDGKVADALRYKLTNNSYAAHQKKFGSERPMSAFFTHFNPRGPKEEQLIRLECGLVNHETGEAKLHDELREMIGYNQRVKEGHIVRSGHIGIISVPFRGEMIRVALFDSLDNVYPLTVGRPEFPIVATLLNNDIIPVTTNGKPLKIV